MVGAAETQRVGVGHVERGHLLRQLGARAALRSRGVVDLVVDVGDVDDQRRLQTLMCEKPLEQAEDHKRAGVADVDAAVDRGPARVDADPARVARAQRLELAAAGVVQSISRIDGQP